MSDDYALYRSNFRYRIRRQTDTVLNNEFPLSISAYDRVSDHIRAGLMPHENAFSDVSAGISWWR